MKCAAHCCLRAHAAGQHNLLLAALFAATQCKSCSTRAVTRLLLFQVEFILMGGTFMSLPLDYRDYFVRNLHDALSGHSSSNVQEAVQFSEQSRTRCIGLTIETRPDYCLTPHLTQVPFLSAAELQQACACFSQ